MKQLSLILLFICNALFANAQRFGYPIEVFDTVNYVVKYNLQYQEDSLNDDYKRDEEMILFIGEQTNKFVSKNFYQFDTCLTQINNIQGFQDFINSQDFVITNFVYQIFKDHHNSEITYYEIIMSNKYTFTEPMGQFNWELHDDTDSINGFFVRKATCGYSGRNWIAWYAPEIPVSDGPYTFNGLPGLILNLYDTDNHYVFSFLSLEVPFKKLYIDMQQKGYTEVDKMDFMKAKDRKWDSFVMEAKQQGSIDNKTTSKVKQVAKTKNNPLELDRQ
jgi:GLPGLI family protein